jgi:sulfate adenylyltransferase
LSLSVTNSSTLISPYGGELVDLMVPPESYAEIKDYASQLPSVQILPRSGYDLELLAIGAFSPLDRFMGRDDFQRVLHEMRLADGHLFPIPITLAVEPSPALHLDRDVALRNNEYELIAIITIDEIYEWDRAEVADKVFGSRDMHHPVVVELDSWGTVNISGRLQVLHLPRHYDFQNLWMTPSQTRTALARKEKGNVVAFQPYNSWQHANKGLTKQMMKAIDGTLLLHPIVGLKKLGDIDHYARISAYKAWTKWYYKPNQILLSLLPLASRMAGPREALWQALIHRNYGANHMIVNRNHASPDRSSQNTTFYGPYAAQALVEKYSHELGVKMVPEQVENENVSKPLGKSGSTSFANIRIDTEYQNNDHALPDLNILPEVTDILAKIHRPRHQQGVCIWFTGLSGSGKSTTAEMLTWLLMEHGRQITVLDGDVVRTHLSKGLGFSKADRDTNVRRIGFVASELVRLGGVVICAVVSPYRAARNDVRNMVGKDQFVEVFVNTPLHICATRDVKGFYAKARRGELKGFTGIDDPYEPPDHPEITLDTINFSPQDNANFIVEHLIQQGFIRNGYTQ